MNMRMIDKKAVKQKIGNKAVVVLPLAVWDSIREKLDRVAEDEEMYASENFKKSIAESRASKKEYSFEEVMKEVMH